MTMEIVDYPVGKITPYENNPRDNDVIIARWEKATGRKAELVEDSRWK